MDTAGAAADAVARWRAGGALIDVLGHQVFLRDHPAADGGQADPLLVLHGFPTCSYDFHQVLPVLAAQRRVVLFDFLGHGLSDKPDLRYGIRLLADVAEAVVTHLGLDRVALLTHDLGDSVGGELLRRDLEGDLPFAVSRRVLTNGSIYMDLVHLSEVQQLLLDLPDERLDLPEGSGDSFRHGVSSTFAPVSRADPLELEAQWQLMRRDRGQSLLPRTIRYIEDRWREERRYTEAIEIHPSPLGVVWGDADPIAVPAMATRLVEVRADAALVMLHDVGHYPMVEAPDLFGRAVRDLLA